jgi:hypothetical protein
VADATEGRDDHVLTEYRRQIQSVLPEADVILTGSALVPDLAADDVDLVALVSEVLEAAELLRSLYPPLHEADWRDDWAAFRVPGQPQVDLVLTVAGSKGDAHHRRAWELIAADPQLLGEYRSLKADRVDYASRKAAFFERVAASVSELR